MLILIYPLIVIAIVFILIGISGLQRQGERRAQLPLQTYPLKPRVGRTFFSRLFPFTPRFLEKLNLDVKIKRRLDTAHLKITAEEFFNLKLSLVIALEIVTFLVVGKLFPPAYFIVFALGYILPDIWLNRKIAKRRYEIARLIPETVDLLNLCVEAGLDFTSAVQWIVEKKVFKNPVIEELTLLMEEIKWGKPRIQALKDMAQRLNIPEVRSLVHTLVQAERMGTPVAEAFAILSEDTRLQRFRRGERFAAQAPIKILIPLIFCILPVIGIVIGGPILIQFTQGGMLQGLTK